MNLPAISIPGGSKTMEITKYAGFAIPASAILLSVLIGFFVVYPKFNEVMQLKESNKQLAANVTKLEDKAAKLASLNKDQLTTRLTYAEQILPSDKGTFLMLRQLENTAGQSGVLLNHLDVQVGNISGKSDAPPAASAPGAAEAKASTPAADASDLQLKMTIAADYRGLLQFLNLLYSSPRAVSIHDIALGASGSQLSASMTIDAYWQAIPSDLGPVDSEVPQMSVGEVKRLDDVANAPITVGTSLPQVPLGRTDLFQPLPE